MNDWVNEWMNANFLNVYGIWGFHKYGVDIISILLAPPSKSSRVLSSQILYKKWDFLSMPRVKKLINVTFSHVAQSLPRKTAISVI